MTDTGFSTLKGKGMASQNITHNRIRRDVGEGKGSLDRRGKGKGT